jgi:hypothetical protein
VQPPKFDLGQLLKAASMAGINPADIPSGSSPWDWADPRAFAWQVAFRSINPVVAQDAEIHHGKPLSLALEAALEGLQPMDPDLARELEIKRPHEHEEMRQQQINDALAGMEESRAAERARRAERTPSPEQLQQQVRASRNAAAMRQREQLGLLGVTGS